MAAFWLWFDSLIAMDNIHAVGFFTHGYIQGLRVSTATNCASSNTTPLAIGVVSGITTLQVVDINSLNWDASSASMDHVSDMTVSWIDSDEDSDSIISDYVSHTPAPATPSGAAGSSTTARATPPHCPYQSTRTVIQGLMGVSSVEHVKYAYCSDSDAGNELDADNISSILSGTFSLSSTGIWTY
ncbi:uncharacterized protein ARMOST_20341 [Armillaria ostoyae]|uniref:Uncharacterized protein n=1 Tax=Armillaria ostoyae TaxID=47428 RepID=A0A284S720_ARMOS|nr:uncharacterized protein ARMOST_20341 [Armillaria ostoyae]